MPTTTVSIGSNQNIDVETPSASSGAGPSYVITFANTPIIKTAGSNGIAVGDIGVMYNTDSAGANSGGAPDPSTYTFLVTAISGSNITLKYLTDTAGKGDASPFVLYTGNGSSGSPEQASMTFQRAFSTIATFEAMVDDASPGYFGSGDDVIGELHADSTFTEGQVTFSSRQSLASVTLTTNEFDRHDGTAESGALLKPASAAGTNVGVIEISITNMTLSFIDLSLDDADLLNTNIGLEISGSSPNNVLIRNCLVHDMDGNPNTSPQYGIRVPPAGSEFSTIAIVNNIIYSLEEAEGGNDNIFACLNQDFNGTSYFDNNTIYNIDTSAINVKQAIGYQYNNATDNDARHFVRNNLIGSFEAHANNRRRFYRDRNGDATVTENNNCDYNNAAGDSSSASYQAPGANSLTDQTLASIAFVSTTAGSEDLHIQSNSVCVDAGADLGTNQESNYDIDGRDRDAQGDTWDMGADEFVEDDSPAVTAGPFIMFVD